MKQTLLFPQAHPAPVHHFHVAVLREPYCSLILAGKKKIESRFSLRRGLPFRQAFPGEKIIFKLSGGGLVGQATIGNTLFTDLDPTEFDLLVAKYAADLCIEQDFLDKKRTSKYASLLWLDNVVRFEKPIPFLKHDQRPWLILGYDPSDIQCEDCIHFNDDQPNEEAEMEETCDIHEGLPLPCVDFDEGD